MKISLENKPVPGGFIKILQKILGEILDTKKYHLRKSGFLAVFLAGKAAMNFLRWSQ